jgi:RimJ/RimL family protein N-acetyltransferase
MGGDGKMSEKHLGPAYRIHTPRLVIRCWNPTDAPLLKTAIDQSLDHLRPWMPWAQSEPEDLEQKIDRLRQFRGRFDLGQDFVYAIFNREETQVLGGAGLHTRVGEEAREIGYWIHKDYLKQGLATETSASLTKVAFEVDHVKRVEIHCDPHNVQSAAIPRKLGFTHEATLRQRDPSGDGRLLDRMIWTLLAEEYRSSAVASANIEAFDAAGRRIELSW